MRLAVAKSHESTYQIIGPFVQAVSAAHDWMGASYGPTRELNLGDLAGLPVG